MEFSKSSLINNDAFVFTPIEDVLLFGERVSKSIVDYKVKLTDVEKRINTFEKMMGNDLIFDKVRLRTNFYDYLFSLKPEFDSKFPKIQADFEWYMETIQNFIDKKKLNADFPYSDNFLCFNSFVKMNSDYYELHELIASNNELNNGAICLHIHVMKMVGNVLASLKRDFCA